MAPVQLGWQRAQRPLPGGRAKPARAVLSSEAAKSPSQEGKGWAPWQREREGQTEGAWCLGL